MIHPVRHDGVGVVARRAGLAAVVSGPDAVSMADVILASTGDAAESIRALAREMLQRDLTSGALVAEVGTEVEVFAFGSVCVIVGGVRHDAAAEILGLSMRVEAAALDAVVPSSLAQPEASWERLEVGMIAGDGFTTIAGHAIAASTAPNAAIDVATLLGDDPETDPPVVEAEPTAPTDYRSIDLSVTVDAVGNAPLPVDGPVGEVADDLPPYQRPVQVLGVMSPRGHFNHPEARYCSRSGVKIGASHTRAFVHGERPSLGIISFDDGLTYSVQWNTVIGRDPVADPRVVSGDAAAFAVGADELAVSRSHLLLELDEWNVLVSDLETANGTWLRPAGETEPRRLAAGERVVISHGAEVTIGERSFVYHEHHVR